LAATTSSDPATVDTICSALAVAAAENDLPIDFFTRLIWKPGMPIIGYLATHRPTCSRDPASDQRRR
jgi:hypothetical protein